MSKLGALHLTKNTGPRHTATVIFFHGSGSVGVDMKEWVRVLMNNFNFPHIKVMYPTAPLQAYTPSGGEMSHVWFDRISITPEAPEKLSSIANMEVLIKNLLKAENDAGIPSNRIIVGGFSMGGALALHTGYRWDRDLAGVFALSTFLNNKSIVYEELRITQADKLPQLMQCHGDADELVYLKWGQNTYNELKALGVQGQFYTLDRLGHTLNKRGLNIVKDWILKLLPDIDE